MIFLNIIVLVFEVLFYSLFMKYSRKDGKLSRYILLFIINSIVVAIFNNKYFTTYVLFVFVAFVGLKYIVKTKTSLYDIIPLIIMLALNLVIELPIYLMFYEILHFNHFIVTMIFEVLKLLIVILLKDKLHSLYKKYKNLWHINNFNIRYCFTIFIYLYIIISIVLKVVLTFKR